jgi:hypothetical protein
VSTGLHPSLPTVAEHDIAHCGVVAGDATSHAVGFTQPRHPPPAVGLDPHRDRVVDGVTGLTHQRRDREVDPAPGSGNGISPPTRRICHLVRRSFSTASSAGNHRPSPECRRRPEQTRSYDR